MYTILCAGQAAGGGGRGVRVFHDRVGFVKLTRGSRGGRGKGNTAQNYKRCLKCTLYLNVAILFS
jgi:hypothetical protein